MRTNLRQGLTMLAFLLATGMGSAMAQQQGTPPPPSKFKLMTSAYAEGTQIPAQYTCAVPTGSSPALQWSNPPQGDRKFCADFSRYGGCAHQRFLGRDALDSVECARHLDLDRCRHPNRRFARRDSAGQERSQRQWLPAAVPASGRRPAPLHLRTLRPRRQARPAGWIEPSRSFESHGRPRHRQSRLRGHVRPIIAVRITSVA